VVEKIIVLGGGTSGLTSALILKTYFPNKEVTIIESSAVGIIGVGEGSTEHWSDFCEVVGLDLEESLVRTGGTIKAGIHFKNWGYPDYYHSTVTGYEHPAGDYLSRMSAMIANNYTAADMVQERTRKNLLPKDWVDGNDPCPVNNFHFNTFKTNEYLHEICAERNINVYDDKIVEVSLDEEGYIKTLIGENSTYDADFFVDCTGFARVLSRKLGSKWISYKDHLKVNSAIAFPTGDTDEYPICTQCTAMDYGWMWQTPVLGRWGNGYVFNDEYIDFDQAQEEIEEKLGYKIEPFKKIKFDAGRIDRSWIKNCVNIGLSCSFVEPLESTAISQGILQAFLLGNMLPGWIGNNENISDIYNEKVDKLNENILDFIILHYVSPRQDTPFWKWLYDNRKEWIPERLQSCIDNWSKRLPLEFEFDKKYTLFKAENWILTMHGMQLIDVESIKKEYSNLHPAVREEAEGYINWLKMYEEEQKNGYYSNKEGLLKWLERQND
jgi:tryptophan halogenase